MRPYLLLLVLATTLSACATTSSITKLVDNVVVIRPKNGVATSFRLVAKACPESDSTSCFSVQGSWSTSRSEMVWPTIPPGFKFILPGTEQRIELRGGAVVNVLQDYTVTVTVPQPTTAPAPVAPALEGGCAVCQKATVSRDRWHRPYQLRPSGEWIAWVLIDGEHELVEVSLSEMPNPQKVRGGDGVCIELRKGGERVAIPLPAE